MFHQKEDVTIKFLQNKITIKSFNGRNRNSIIKLLKSLNCKVIGKIVNNYLIYFANSYHSMVDLDNVGPLYKVVFYEFCLFFFKVQLVELLLIVVENFVPISIRVLFDLQEEVNSRVRKNTYTFNNKTSY